MANRNLTPDSTDPESADDSLQEFIRNSFNSASARKSAKCNRLFNFNKQMKFMGLVKNDASEKAEFGKIFHSLIECRFLNFSKWDAIDYARNNHPQFGEKGIYGWEGLLKTWSAYCEKYPIEKEPMILNMGIETELSPNIEYHWKDEQTQDDSDLIDQGFIDRNVLITPENSLFHLGKQIDSPEIWVVDTKTTSLPIVRPDGRVQLLWSTRYKEDIQAALYVRYMRSQDMEYPIAGFCVDGVEHPAKNFVRLYIPYDDEKCKRIIDKSNEMVQNAIENPEVPSWNHCNDYGGCKFAELCMNKKYTDLPFWEQLPKFADDQKLKGEK